MVRRVLLTLVAVALLVSDAMAQSDDLDTLFQSMRSILAGLPLDPAVKTHAGSLLDLAQQEADNPLSPFYVVGELLESFLFEIYHHSLQQNTSQSGQVSPQQDADGDQIVELLALADEIRAKLFFAAPPLLINPSVQLPQGESGCEVTILERTLGPILFDPGGVRWTRLAEVVDLEALGAPGGGSYQWRIEPAEETRFYSSGSRLMIRPIEPFTYRVTVVYRPDSETSCQDTVFVKVFGRLGEDQ